MNLTNYVNMWDNIIKELLNNPPQKSYPLSYGIAIQSDFMPEPFMGDPDNCSFVIVNLNPGAGQCHSCIEHKNIVGTLVNRVKTKGYSKAVEDFPYLKNEDSVGLINWDNSAGRKWWKAKERWIKHIIKMYEPSYNPLCPIPKDRFPFAMELFAWHTAKWPNNLNNKMKKGGIYGSCIKSDVLDPIYEAIQKSKCKFAYCVGKPIGDIIDSFAYSVNFTKINSQPIKPIPDIERYYDVYSDAKGCFIVNTWAQGGNTYPSDKFYKAEENLFRQYKIAP